MDEYRGLGLVCGLSIGQNVCPSVIPTTKDDVRGPG